MDYNPNNYRGSSRSELESEASAIKKLNIGGLACAAISVIIGGVALSTIGIIVSAIGLRRAGKVIKQNPGDTTGVVDRQIKPLYNRAKGIVCAAVVALVLNAASIAYYWPEIQQFIETGDPVALYERLGGQAPSGNESSGDFWGSGAVGTQKPQGDSFWG